MIISEKFRYVFLELEHTASTAISEELKEYYSGFSILKRHKSYNELKKYCKEYKKDYLDYFIFSCVRNPLDIAVTHYHYYKDNYLEMFTKGRPKYLNKKHYEKFEKIQSGKYDFYDFLRMNYRFPYDNWSIFHRNKIDFMMRYESIDSDFNRILNLLGIDQIRLLPKKNVITTKPDFKRYYSTPKIIQLAIKIFGSYMKLYNYELPISLEIKIPLLTKIQFSILKPIRKRYWSYKQV